MKESSKEIVFQWLYRKGFGVMEDVACLDKKATILAFHPRDNKAIQIEFNTPFKRYQNVEDIDAKINKNIQEKFILSDFKNLKHEILVDKLEAWLIKDELEDIKILQYLKDNNIKVMSILDFQ